MGPIGRIAARVRNAAGLALLGGYFASRAITKAAPRAISLHERLAMLPRRGVPVKRRVVVHWSDNQIPFIEAASDTDLATALGLVHAHLRGAQMEMLRRLSQGRISEVIGPVGLDFDHLLRILDFGRAVPDILAGLPAETRQWLEAFVDGINHHLAHAAELPHEFSVLALGREPWTASDVLRIGRLVAADVNWLVWFKLLRLREAKDWPRLWQRLAGDGNALASYALADTPALSLFAEALGSSARWASNSVAVSAARSVSGGALIANDPHLGLHLPGPWLIVGLSSPGYQAVGLMPPGLPFIALGRNRWIAWGGTNLHAASSDFYDVSDHLPEAVTRRRETIKVRWWPDREVAWRETPLGPVVSDAPLLGLHPDRPVALRWMGHRPSDEFTAMLKVTQARNWDDYRAAMDEIAVPGLHVTYADRDGLAGRAMAAHLPARPSARLESLVLDSRETGHWQRVVTGRDLSCERDPNDGFVAAANERPGEDSVPIGFFFSPPDRALRLRELIGPEGPVGFENLKAALNDVYGPTPHALCREFVERLEGAERMSASAAHLVKQLAAWDGRYDSGSTGALVFELVFHRFVRATYGRNALRAYWATWQPRSMVLEDLRRGDRQLVATSLRDAVRGAVRPFRRFKTWGGMHRLWLAHPFGHVPIFGRRYVWCDRPADGTSGTVYATGHNLHDGRHAAEYGAGARHLSDHSDLDRNEFVLLGGQDGWLGSSTYADQLNLWREGTYLRVPLRLETVRAEFPHRTELLP